MVWFGLGTTAFIHGAITGGGFECAILSWQIEHWGKIHPSSVQVPLGFALILPPLLLLALDAGWAARRVDRAMLATIAKGGLIAASSRFAVALLAFGLSRFTPDPHAAPVRIMLGRAAPESVGEHTAILVGVLQTGCAVSYKVLRKIGRYPHTIVPDHGIELVAGTGRFAFWWTWRHSRPAAAISIRPGKGCCCVTGFPNT